MKTPPVVSPREWQAAHAQMLAKEKAFIRSRDALAAERRRMPWMAVEGCRQLIVYRAFFEPGVHGWPDHGCIGCSMVTDQVGHLSHLKCLRSECCARSENGSNCRTRVKQLFGTRKRIRGHDRSGQLRQ
jgi:predicted dithiol-disulfide oxidoreductase (DUF899 family)